MEPHTAGDPMSSRKWLNCRLSDIQERLGKHRVSKPVISRLLQAHDYRLRANTKQICSQQNPERNLQFEHIQAQRQQHQEAGAPRISTDTKKKELIGNFLNPGQIWCQAAERVHVHDFKQASLGRAVPYGVYDLQFNRGTVYLGRSADTPAFAVDNIAAWCATERLERFPTSQHLMIETDSGGSNSAVSRAWKYHLQNKVSDRFGLIVTVCHYPTGASKWNPIEHRLFSEISKTWAGCPLRTFAIAAHYIRETNTHTGLKVCAHLIRKKYATGEKISAEIMATLNIVYHTVCPQWNYTIYPRGYCH
ncbi:MAG: ISAzo13 family transposase [Pyrinomonadaceae bacterium]|nr:ISAzo13 family transposase [Pyrinomonadaceae bacterium]